MLKTRDSSPFIVYFLAYFCQVVVANDPRTSLHHSIIVNVYWVCLATESMNEIYVNNFKDEIVRKKKNQQHSNT